MGKNPQNMLIQSGTNFSKFLSNHFSRFVKHVHFSSWHCKPGKFIPSIVRKILQNHLSRLCSTLHSVQIRCESFGMLCRKPGKWVGIRELRPDFVAKAFFWKAFIKEMLQVASNCGATHPADPNLFIVYKMPKIRIGRMCSTTIRRSLQHFLDKGLPKECFYSEIWS